MSQHDWGRVTRRTLATIGVATLALFGAVAAGSTAHADDEPTTTQVANINPEAKGSITVHKFKEKGSEVKLNPDGSSSTVGYEPLQGVEFSLYTVPGLSVLNPDDWAKFNALSYNSGTGMVSGPGFGPVAPVLVASDTTNASGVVAFGSPTPLNLGVYLIIEGDPGTNIITAHTAPFFVTVPLPHNNTWLYDVHVYPKNSVGAVTKTADQNSAHKVGDIIKWPVTATIPQLPAGQSYASFAIRDLFDARLDTLTVDSVTVGGNPATYTTTGSVGQLMIVNPNLTAINANQGGQVVVVFSTRVASLGPDGVIFNQAFMDLPGNVSVPSNKPFHKFGALRIDKFQNGAQGPDTSKPLNGASFALYLTQAEATAALAGTVGTPVWTGTITTDGTITTPGFYVGNSTDNVNMRTYYLVETQAPAGYTRTDTVIPVDIVPSGTTAVTIAQVGNTQRPPVELPLTGSTGTAVFVAGGLGLLLLAGGASIIAVRRRQGAAEK